MDDKAPPPVVRLRSLGADTVASATSSIDGDGRVRGSSVSSTTGPAIPRQTVGRVSGSLLSDDEGDAPAGNVSGGLPPRSPARGVSVASAQALIGIGLAEEDAPVSPQSIEMAETQRQESLGSTGAPRLTTGRVADGMGASEAPTPSGGEREEHGDASAPPGVLERSTSV